MFFAVKSVAFAAEEKNILVIGDSLTAGYGLPINDGLTAQLEDALNLHYKGRFKITVENAGVSGDTTSAGLSRIAWVLSGKNPDLVILEFGANDMMRGINPKVAYDNMDKMLKILSDKKMKILLAGMISFPNMGKKYSDEFNKIYPLLAKKHGAALYPFFLKDVAAVPSLNQADAIHPNKKGIAVIVKNIVPLIVKSLKTNHSPQ